MGPKTRQWSDLQENIKVHLGTYPFRLIKQNLMHFSWTGHTWSSRTWLRVWMFSSGWAWRGTLWWLGQVGLRRPGWKGGRCTKSWAHSGSISHRTQLCKQNNFKHVKLNSIIHTVKHRLKRNTYPSGNFCYLNRGFNPASFIKKPKVGLYIVIVSILELFLG